MSVSSCPPLGRPSSLVVGTHLVRGKNKISAQNFPTRVLYILYVRQDYWWNERTYPVNYQDFRQKPQLRSRSIDPYAHLSLVMTYTLTPYCSFLTSEETSVERLIYTPETIRTPKIQCSVPPGSVFFFLSFFAQRGKSVGYSLCGVGKGIYSWEVRVLPQNLTHNIVHPLILESPVLSLLSY